jgi:phage shock protein C
MASEPKKLYRSRTNRMLAGVAGGLAEYFSIDPLVVRLVFVVAAIFGVSLGWLKC